MAVPKKEREIVRKWFPILLREDPAFREEVMAQLTGVLATKDDIAKILAKLEEHAREIKRLSLHIDALGARWGTIAEELFREGLSGKIEDLGYKVMKWRVFDDKGKVYGQPAMIEADVLIKDKKHYLIEIKSSVSKFDASGFYRIGKLYEEITGEEPKLLIISPYIKKEAINFCKEVGIEFYSSFDEAFPKA